MAAPHKAKVEDGVLYVWEQDPEIFPQGLWLPVCRECRRGPLSDNQRWCGDFNDTRPGFCIKKSHPHIK